MVEHLPGKCEALSSNSSTATKKKKKVAIEIFVSLNDSALKEIPGHSSFASFCQELLSPTIPSFLHQYLLAQ
jgi:hypothetical protein